VSAAGVFPLPNSYSDIIELIRHLKNNFPVMHRLYSALHTQAQLPSDEQVKLAQGAIPVNGDAAKAYLGKVEMAASSILKGLEQQAKKAKVSYHFIHSVGCQV
jgi:hypothetical protein